MLADFFTKPLQGSLFTKFRDVVMEEKHIDSLKETKPTPSQERVGEDDLLENIGNGLDGQKTDVSTPEPSVRMSYADVVKRRQPEGAKAGAAAPKAVTFQTKNYPIVLTV